MVLGTKKGRAKLGGASSKRNLGFLMLFVTCGQGLETLLADELSELGFRDLEPGFCGVNVKDCSMESIYAINYRSRLAGRVLLPLVEFHCPNKKALYQKSLAFDWSTFFTKNQSFAIDAHVRHYAFNNSLFAAQVLKDAICDQLREARGIRPNIDIKNPDIQLNLYIDEEKAIISFDTSNQPLYKRNYRAYTGSAPLQETLAAALLRIAHYGGETLIDPCCGSGTLLIEAACMLTNTPPGFWREKWGFFEHPDFNEAAWLSVKNTADSLRKPLKKGLLCGLEREPEIAQYCRMNLKRAGFFDDVEIVCTNFMSYTPSLPYSFLITNPPHGKRLGFEEGLIAMYRALGDFMKQKMAKPGRGFLFTTSKVLSKEVGLSAKRRHVVSSAGLEARLLEFDLY